MTNFLYEFQRNDSKLSEQFYPKGNTAINHRQVTIQLAHMANQTHFGNRKHGNLGICVSQKISRHQYCIQIQDLKKIKNKKIEM